MSAPPWRTGTGACGPSNRIPTSRNLMRKRLIRAGGSPTATAAGRRRYFFGVDFAADAAFFCAFCLLVLEVFFGLLSPIGKSFLKIPIGTSMLPHPSGSSHAPGSGNVREPASIAATFLPDRSVQTT